MSSPTPAILAFYIREDTYIKKSIRPKSRAWLRAKDRAWRSFYKFVCKEGYFNTLERRDIRHPWRDTNPETIPEQYLDYYRRPWGNYSRGIPMWSASSNHVRDVWEREFKNHLQAVEEADFLRSKKLWELRTSAIERISLLKVCLHSQTIQLTKLSHALRTLANKG